MNLKLTLALAASLVTFTSMAQENILDMRENYNIGQTVTVTGVVTSDDNLGSVRYLQDATAGIALTQAKTGLHGTRPLRLATA